MWPHPVHVLDLLKTLMQGVQIVFYSKVFFRENIGGSSLTFRFRRTYCRVIQSEEDYQSIHYADREDDREHVDIAERYGYKRVQSTFTMREALDEMIR